MNSELVSIIMPAFNAELFIEEAVNSVLKQSHRNWELIIVNDGSTDDTESIVKSIKDHRILYIKQNNAGVSAARNKAFEVMNGKYICFLDADDVLPPNSIESRLSVFEKNDETAFVDGIVEKRSIDWSVLVHSHHPSFRGYPLNELVKLSSSCFAGLTWLIKRKSEYKYSMQEGLTHGEDLLFLMGISNHGLFDYATTTTYLYRQAPNTAMRNLDGLKQGYKTIYLQIKKNSWASKKGLFLLRLKMARIMAFSYLKEKQFFKAILAIYEYLLLK